MVRNKIIFYFIRTFIIKPLIYRHYDVTIYIDEWGEIDLFSRYQQFRLSLGGQWKDCRSLKSKLIFFSRLINFYFPGGWSLPTFLLHTQIINTPIADKQSFHRSQGREIRLLFPSKKNKPFLIEFPQETESWVLSFLSIPANVAGWKMESIF